MKAFRVWSLLGAAALLCSIVIGGVAVSRASADPADPCPTGWGSLQPLPWTTYGGCGRALGGSYTTFAAAKSAAQGLGLTSLTSVEDQSVAVLDSAGSTLWYSGKAYTGIGGPWDGAENFTGTPDGGGPYTLQVRDFGQDGAPSDTPGGNYPDPDVMAAFYDGLPTPAADDPGSTGGTRGALPSSAPPPEVTGDASNRMELGAASVLAVVAVFECGIVALLGLRGRGSHTSAVLDD